jgi:hypothetical protein
MNTRIIEINGVKITEVISDDIIIRDTQDALNLMAESRYNDSDKIILKEANILAGFFDLKTGIAGEILQKVSNYRMQLAIVGDFSKYTSKSLRDFIFESNKQGRVSFVSSLEEAKQCLLKNQV